MRWGSSQTQFLQEEPVIVDHREIYDSCLPLAIDMSAKKTQSWKDHILIQGLLILRKRSCPYQKSKSEGVISENMRRPTPSTQRMEYMSFVGTVTTLLRVVAPHTLCWWMDFQGDPPNLTFFLASPNLEDEIHFKGGSL